MAGLDPAIHVVPVTRPPAKIHHGDTEGAENHGDASVVRRPFHFSDACRSKHVDGRVKPGHDGDRRRIYSVWPPSTVKTAPVA
jgi:hypothetical protein